jgi:hypothetical protein
MSTIAVGQENSGVGDPLLIPPRTPHNALDIAPGTGMMVPTYVVEPEEPLASFTRTE